MNVITSYIQKLTHQPYSAVSNNPRSTRCFSIPDIARIADSHTAYIEQSAKKECSSRNQILIVEYMQSKKYARSV